MTPEILDLAIKSYPNDTSILEINKEYKFTDIQELKYYDLF